MWLKWLHICRSQELPTPFDQAADDVMHRATSAGSTASDDQMFGTAVSNVDRLRDVPEASVAQRHENLFAPLLEGRRGRSSIPSARFPKMQLASFRHCCRRVNLNTTQESIRTLWYIGQKKQDSWLHLPCAVMLNVNARRNYFT